MSQASWSPAWDEAIHMCNKTIYVYHRKRMICFGENDCIKYRTKKQFEVVYEMMAKMIECCKEYEYKVIDEAKKNCDKGTVWI